MRHRSGKNRFNHELIRKRVQPVSHVGMWLKNKDCNLVAICDKIRNNFQKQKN